MAELIEDPSLKNNFNKVTKYLSKHLLRLNKIVDNSAKAYYFPSDSLDLRYIAFVEPAYANPNILTHEVTHARFDDFETNLHRWLEQKDYVLPYNVDYEMMGPLDELNSYRMEQRPLKDEEILNFIDDAYRASFGDQVLNRFSDVWPVEKLKGKSVTRLLIQEIKNFNKMSPQDLVELGVKSLSAKGVEKFLAEENFVRLVTHRYGFNVPKHLSLILEKIFKQTSNKKLAVRTLELLKNNIETKMDLVFESYVKSLKSYQGQHVKLKGPLRQFPVVFDFAARKNITDYDEVLNGLNHIFERAWLAPSDNERELFERVMSTKGKTAAKKIGNYIIDFRKKGVENFLQWFLESGDAAAGKIIASVYLDQLSSKDLIAIFSKVLSRETESEKRKVFFNFIQSAFDRYGFTRLHAYTDTLQSSRPKIGVHPLVSPEMDLFLSIELKNSKPSATMEQIVTLIKERLRPDELPILRETLLTSLKAGEGFAYDFIGPLDVQEEHGLHQSWEELMSAEAVKSPQTRSRILTRVAFHHQESFGEHLPPLASHQFPLTQKVTEAANKTYQQLTAAQKSNLKTTANQLWILLEHKDTLVRRAARYALMSNVLFIVELKDKILRETTKPKNLLRAEELKIFAEVVGETQIENCLKQSARRIRKKLLN